MSATYTTPSRSRAGISGEFGTNVPSPAMSIPGSYLNSREYSRLQVSARPEDTTDARQEEEDSLTPNETFRQTGSPPAVKEELERLRRALYAQRTEELSPFETYQILGAKRSLEVTDVLDVGIGVEGGARFRVEDSLYERVCKSVGELQSILSEAASLVHPERRYFQIDPENTLLTQLGGSAELGLLSVVWIMLLKRMDTAIRMFEKYEAQAKHRVGLAFDNPTSPASTASELHETLRTFEDPQERTRHLVSQFPRHRGLAFGDAEKLADGEAWDVIFPPTKVLREAFPVEREGSKSTAMYYVPKGEEYSRVLVETNPRLPVKEDQSTIPESVTTRRKSQKRVSLAVPGHPDEDDSAEEVEKSLRPEPPLVARADLLPPLLMNGTPFKSRKAFFESTPAPYRKDPRTSLSQEPNVLRGIAAANYGVNWTRRTSSLAEELTRRRDDEARSGDEQREEGRLRGSSAGGQPPNGGPPDDDDDDNWRGPSHRRNQGVNRRGNGRSGGPPNGSGPSGNGHPGGPPGGGPPNGGSVGSGDSNDGTIPPYGSIVPTIKPELKLDSLPTWDGNPSTAVTYFFEVQQLATLGGHIPVAMGFWLWNRLKDGSTVKTWFSTLPPSTQAHMKTHYLEYLRGIRDGFLGSKWQLEMNIIYKAQRFRQRGYEEELPKDFITRRILYTRMLADSDQGGPLEVWLVMETAPLSWKPLINFDSIKSTSDLYTKVSDHEASLVASFKSDSRRNITADNLADNLRRLGFEVRSRNPRPAQFARNVQLNQARDEASDEEEEDSEISKDAYNSFKAHPKPVNSISNNPKPYLFPKNDKVITKLAKKPPSPCRACGSKNHWNRECPDWNLYLEKSKRNVNLGESLATEVDEKANLEEMAYSNAYNAQISQYWMEKDSSDAIQQDFEPATSISSINERECKTVEALQDDSEIPLAANAFRSSRGRTTIEEVEDEHWIKERGRRSREPHDGGILEEAEGETVDESVEAEKEKERVGFTAPKVIKLERARNTNAGRSTIGVSVLSMKGRVGRDPSSPEIDLRLDSGADISLISEDFFKSLKNSPPIKTGLKLQVWQLTNGNTTLRGYVTMPIRCRTDTGEVVEMEAELYIVPGMTVPLLLGEDFQINFEIGVKRDVNRGTQLLLDQGRLAVRAQAVEPNNDRWRVRKDAQAEAKFVKAKSHRRSKADRLRRLRKFGEEGKKLRATRDYLLKPGQCVNIEVEGFFEDDQEYLTEKAMFRGQGTILEESLVVPNVLFTPEKPLIPIGNPSTHPQWVRKGEVIASCQKADHFLDSPKSEKGKQEMTRLAHLYSTIIHSVHDHQSSKGPVDEDDDLVGPKTAETPDPEEYSSTQLEEIIDIGDLPDPLKPKVWEMLRKRVGAFGFDGRLGHHPAKAKIRLKEGQEPISLPMYASSPEKRRVIDEQIDKWFEQEVIEPSRSPWGAPVVIAYRNSKPRFCVDYRKLNAVTIPDEFPIPRQSEILSSLAGAQVLSSLDALSGFTQLEMAEEDREKTAFRSHRGLFHFKRMPFGLRNGPSIFQRVMQGILSPFLWLFCLVYIDDIVVYSQSYEEHIGHLDVVLEAIENAGITLSPKKCHLFYSSILLLGHKVSRLGLSTHEEKVKAILELSRPTKVSQLQTFLGMAVYFSAFIPYYADVCGPLFQLLRKGAKWSWKAEHEHAFQEVKKALQSAPVLGHPMENLPYRLYTDASDEALGCALQQVQPILIKDLKGTRAYKKLQEAYEKKESIPSLVTKIGSSKDLVRKTMHWGDSFEHTTVLVERVVGYWSRRFKDAETRYSTTEREALAAKEGLVKFQPYLEGEHILLVTDHAALQWAKTYENSNRRLAAWGAIFSAYAPGLEIVHRAGRVHSNVDPLSRIPRDPPEHVSPPRDEQTSLPLNLDSDLLSKQEEAMNRKPADRMGLVVNRWEECVEVVEAYQGATRKSARTKKPSWKRAAAEEERGEVSEETDDVVGDDQASPGRRTVEMTEDSSAELSGTSHLWKAIHAPVRIHVELGREVRKTYQEAYFKDTDLKKKWEQAKKDEEAWRPGQRFFLENGLLFFKDEDSQPKLCVPRGMIGSLLAEAHESPGESAHAGPEKLWLRLKERFYWNRMKADVLRFCKSCDICQKTKTDGSRKPGLLRPTFIPSRPFQSISMDFIVNLPWSEGFNAIYVVVDRLTKYALFIPTDTGLDAEGFAQLFVKEVASRYGIPENLIADRDPRWTSDFWKGVAKALKTSMSLTSSHHPQLDGQTERLNRQLEVMLRAYVSEDLQSWAQWLRLLEFAYNTTVHSSTNSTPQFLLHGFHARTPLDLLVTRDDDPDMRTLSDEGKSFVQKMEFWRGVARRSIAKAQEEQARFHDKRRKDMPDFQVGSLVLVNPHSLEWKESKGEGAKLVQRWIGPFEVAEVVNPNVYRLKLNDKYPGSPVFNVEHLKKYISSEEEWGVRRAELSETRQQRAATEEYPVEKLVGHKRDKRKGLMYLVRWEGFGPQFDTWQSAYDLRNAPELLRKYRAKHLL